MALLNCKQIKTKVQVSAGIALFFQK